MLFFTIVIISLLCQLIKGQEKTMFDCAAAGAPGNGVSRHSISPTCDENFVYCVNGRGFWSKCPPNTAFHPEKKDCDLKENVPGCAGQDLGYQKWTAGNKYEGKEVNDCSMRESGQYPMLFGDCNQYILCTHNRAYSKRCPFNLLFDMESGECKMASFAKCWRPNGPNGKPNKYFPTHDVVYYPNFEDDLETLVAVMANPDGFLTPQKECPYGARKASEKFETTTGGIVITNPVYKNDGDWGEWMYCPPGSYANGISTFRRSKMQRGKVDNVGVISIALQCQFPEKLGKLDEVNTTIYAVAAGAPPTDKQFSKYWSCEDGAAAIGFQVNSETDRGVEDDIATANVRLICSCGPPAVKPYWLQGVYSPDANRQGDWTPEQGCKPRQAICGMQAQLMSYVDKVDLAVHDNTGLNNLKTKCCDVPNPLQECSPIEREILVATCNNLASDAARACEFDAQQGVGFDYSQSVERSVYFHESVGYTLDFQMKLIQKKMATDEIHCGMGKCLYQWTNDTGSVWQPEKTMQIRTNVHGGWTAEIFQIIGECGFYKMYTNRFMRMDSDGTMVKISRDFWDFGLE